MSTAAREITQEQRGANLAPYRFKPGNPGRPKGSRNKLGEAFIQALHDDFEKHGAVTIVTVREKHPKDYLKVVAAVIPQEVHHTVEDYDGYSDDELAAEFFGVARALQERAGVSLGIAAPPGSGDVPERPALAAGERSGTEGRGQSVGEGKVRRGSDRS